MEISMVKLAVWKQAVPDLQHAPISSGNCNINADALCITSTKQFPNQVEKKTIWHMQIVFRRNTAITFIHSTSYYYR